MESCISWSINRLLIDDPYQVRPDELAFSVIFMCRASQRESYEEFLCALYNVICSHVRHLRHQNKFFDKIWFVCREPAWFSFPKNLDFLYARLFSWKFGFPSKKSSMDFSIGILTETTELGNSNFWGMKIRWTRCRSSLEFDRLANRLFVYTAFNA